MLVESQEGMQMWQENLNLLQTLWNNLAEGEYGKGGDLSNSENEWVYKAKGKRSCTRARASKGCLSQVWVSNPDIIILTLRLNN